MIEYTLNGIHLKLQTESSLFSPRRIDTGTLTMPSQVPSVSLKTAITFLSQKKEKRKLPKKLQRKRFNNKC